MINQRVKGDFGPKNYLFKKKKGRNMQPKMSLVIGRLINTSRPCR